jgi:hypothetical protein
MKKKKDGFDDLPLFARHGDPDTSHKSMREFDRETMKNAMNRVVALLKNQGPMADFELREAFGVEGHAYRQARSMARDQGKIIDTADRRMNPKTKRWQIVWAYCEGEPPTIRKCPECGHVLGREDKGGGEQVPSPLIPFTPVPASASA